MKRDIVKAILASTALILPLAACSRGPEEATPVFGLEEKLGANVPLEVTLRDEQGRDVVLRDLVRRPTLVCFVYYRCPGICTPLLTDLAELLDRSKVSPGKDFDVLTISFDFRDTPEMAAKKRQSYHNLLKKRTIPEDSWRFLTGDEASTKRLTDAVGFQYVKDGTEFRHPGVLIMLSPEGRVIRYLVGKNFQPFDLEMATAEAARNETGVTVRRVLLLCFNYDPKGRRYVFNTTKVVGAVTVLLVGAFFLYLVLSRKRRVKGT